MHEMGDIVLGGCCSMAMVTDHCADGQAGGRALLLPVGKSWDEEV